jgi:hypothetical protein
LFYCQIPFLRLICIAFIYSESECTQEFKGPPCNNACAGDGPFLDSVLLHLEKSGKDVAWGELGPRLITSVIRESGYEEYVDPAERYYPVDDNDLLKLFDPEFNAWSHTRVSDSSAVHLWNEVIKRLCIPKNMLPPEGSFLLEKFIEVSPQLDRFPSLPFEKVKRLFDYRTIKSEYDRKAIKTISYAAQIVEKIWRKNKIIYKLK